MEGRSGDFERVSRLESVRPSRCFLIRPRNRKGQFRPDDTEATADLVRGDIREAVCPFREGQTWGAPGTVPTDCSA